MQLITGLDNDKYNYEMNVMGHHHQPTSVLTESWIHRRHSQWATNYDVDIAQLDFDYDEDNDTQMMSDGGREEKVWMVSTDNSDVNKNTPLMRRKRLVITSSNNNNNNNANTLPPIQTSTPLVMESHTMRHSLEMSSGDASLFTSSVCDPDILYDQIVRERGAQSTDSLDVNDIDSEHLRAVCTAKARDYCLTFSKMTDSASVIVSPHGIAIEMENAKTV